MKVVIDASVTLAWFLREEGAQAIGYAPGVLGRLREDPVEAVVPASWHIEAARSLRLPIATLDGGIRAACRAHGVKLLAP